MRVLYLYVYQHWPREILVEFIYEYMIISTNTLKEQHKGMGLFVPMRIWAIVQINEFGRLATFCF